MAPFKFTIMCFFIEKKRILKAKEDIKCFKVVYDKGDHFDAYWRNFQYEEGFHYYNEEFKEKVQKVIDSYKDQLHGEGFHSYTNIRVLRANNSLMFSSEVIIKCIIPKGAYYLVNEKDGEYISSDLIIVGKYGNRGKKKPAKQGVSTL